MRIFCWYSEPWVRHVYKAFMYAPDDSVVLNANWAHFLDDYRTLVRASYRDPERNQFNIRCAYTGTLAAQDHNVVITQ
ncbi:hypothetical protein AVEN_136892-1 [Araneus ventricosus]|uniref:Uncharacterized protein n=1 Tax=Araneus ventricosus TaxID=182803 RepID=A0A4Y2BGL7_ARAVE|nr:hypothetical protein AVEN_136892-1 [Araneus ventricosus]